MNPELRRLLWLEATPQRLWLTPLALFGSAFVVGRYAEVAVPSLALLGFVGLALFWGMRQAANAVLDEVREHTWDLQRMSALSPWAMTWGKLAGATLMPWYAGACALAIYFAYRPPEMLALSVTWAVFLALSAVVAQGLGLLGAVVGIHRDQQRRAHLHLALVLVLLGMALPDTLGVVFAGLPELGPESGRVAWYGRSFAGADFTLALAASLAAWAVFGAHRAMCIELKVRTRPWAWSAFALYLAIIAHGFWSQDGNASAGGLFSVLALVAALLAYVAGFAFARDPVQYRRLLQAWRDGHGRRVVEDLPLWLSSIGLALACALAAAALGAAPALSNERPDNLGGAALALVLLALRDLALLTAFSFFERSRRAEILSVLIIALLNHLAPAFLLAIGAAPLAGLVSPALFDSPAVAALVTLVQAGAASALAVFAWRRAMAGTQPTR
ncbi:MAG: hypothetical protein H6977_05595 [Gammaproteobacteria bacterium]|nr:hypothetical protein [Gammaproteobacteria bacterium]MCP5199462.1 hypothetical protein [Gammaproteobacteria bacterium]